MKKIILSLSLIALLPLLSGCQKTTKEQEEGVINPMSPDSMVNTYQNSKGKINDNVKKENEKINNALEESGMNE